MNVALKIIIGIGSFFFTACQIQKSEKSNEKIIGGLEAESGSFDAVVELGTCSATRVGPYSYLTAKHCVASNHWQVGEKVVGHLVYKEGPKHEFAGTIDQIHEHPSKDIALMHVMFESPPVGIAVLGKEPATGPVAATGYGCSKLFVSGGTTYPGESLGYLQVVFTDLYEATGGNYDRSRYYYIKGISSTSLGDVQLKGSALCPGDSGGGLFSNQGEVYEIVGVNSGVHPYTAVSTFVRTDVFAHYNWIQSKIR